MTPVCAACAGRRDPGLDVGRVAADTLRERRYVRYMDDFAVIHHDKAHLHEVRRACEDFLWAELGLRTNAKTQVFPIGEPGRALDFLGYRIWPTHRALRKDCIHRMKRKMRRMASQYHRGEITWDDIDPVIMSWIGHARHADTYNLRTKVLGGVAFVPPPLHVAAERRSNAPPLGCVHAEQPLNQGEHSID